MKNHTIIPPNLTTAGVILILCGCASKPAPVITQTPIPSDKQMINDNGSSNNIAAKQTKVNLTYSELADLVGQTRTVVEGDIAERAKAESDANKLTGDAYDSEPSNANNILNTLGRSVIERTKSIHAINKSLVDLENTSLLSDPLKYIENELFIRSELELQKGHQMDALANDVTNMKNINLLRQQGYEANKQIGATISDQQLKAKLEYIEAKARIETASRRNANRHKSE